MVTNIIYATIIIVIVLPFVYIYFWINVNSLRYFTMMSRMAVMPVHFQQQPTMLVSQPPPYGSSFQPQGGPPPVEGGMYGDKSQPPNTASWQSPHDLCRIIELLEKQIFFTTEVL